jgi:hypothetical protein
VCAYVYNVSPSWALADNDMYVLYVFLATCVWPCEKDSVLYNNSFWFIFALTVCTITHFDLFLLLQSWTWNLISTPFHETEATKFIFRDRSCNLLTAEGHQLGFRWDSVGWAKFTCSLSVIQIFTPQHRSTRLISYRTICDTDYVGVWMVFECTIQRQLKRMNSVKLNYPATTKKKRRE